VADEKNLAERIRKRSNCCKGPNEKAAEEKKAAMDADKLTLDVLMALTAKLKAGLGENDKLIEEVGKLLGGTVQAEVLYVFLKLLRSHNALRPDDVGKDCKTFDGYTIDDICKDKSCPNNEPDDGACVEKSPAGGATQTTTEPPRAVPWIVDPTTLDGLINCAAQDYRTAKNAAADAEAAYKAAPDDIESLKNRLATVRKELEGKIRECLRNQKPEEKCCTTEPPKPCGDEDQTKAT
jgi:hypothetical protein